MVKEGLPLSKFESLLGLLRELVLWIHHTHFRVVGTLFTISSAGLQILENSWGFHTPKQNNRGFSDPFQKKVGV